MCDTQNKILFTNLLFYIWWFDEMQGRTDPRHHHPRQRTEGQQSQAVRQWATIPQLYLNIMRNIHKQEDVILSKVFYVYIYFEGIATF